MSFQSVMDELRVQYLAGFPQKILTLEEAVITKNRDLVELEFHKLKGTGSTYGLPEVSLLGETVEKVCQSTSKPLQSFMPFALETLKAIHKARGAGQVLDLKLHPAFLELIKIIQSP